MILVLQRSSSSSADSKRLPVTGNPGAPSPELLTAPTSRRRWPTRKRRLCDRREPADAIPRASGGRSSRSVCLNGLEEQVSVSNQTLRAAEAPLPSRPMPRSGLRARGSFPTIEAAVGATRGRDSGTRYAIARRRALGSRSLWGRIRRLVRGGAAPARRRARRTWKRHASSRQAELATNYFQLRVTDVSRELLEDTAKRSRPLRLTQNRCTAPCRRQGGRGAAESQCKALQAASDSTCAPRGDARARHRDLIGKPPADLHLEPTAFRARIRKSRRASPRRSCRRRPDIAAADARHCRGQRAHRVAEAATSGAHAERHLRL